MDEGMIIFQGTYEQLEKQYQFKELKRLITETKQLASLQPNEELSLNTSIYNADCQDEKGKCVNGPMQGKSSESMMSGKNSDIAYINIEEELKEDESHSKSSIRLFGKYVSLCSLWFIVGLIVLIAVHAISVLLKFFYLKN